MIAAERLPDVVLPPVQDDREAIGAYLEDASGAPPGKAAGLLRVSTEAEAAAFLRQTQGLGVRVLPQAARSSLTGGAIPAGEVIVSVERLVESGRIERSDGGARQTVGAGTRLRDLQARLAHCGFYYPPVPTYQEAMIGGTASTNAGGAATFKYGATRRWVHGLRVLLSNGDLLVLERGQAVAGRGRPFRIRLSDGRELVVPAPDHVLPDLNKISAGYYASDSLDLVDLFVGSEGTLGLITAVTVDLVPLPPAVLTGLIFVPDEARTLRLAAALRDAAVAARASGDRLGPDLRAIESMDRRCLDLLRTHGDARRVRVDIPDDAAAALLFEMELGEEFRSGADACAVVEDDLVRLFDGADDVPDGGLTRLFRALETQGALEGLELAFPGDERRGRAVADFREAVPRRVLEIISARRLEHPALSKVSGDMIVPWGAVPEILSAYQTGFERRGLEYAVWGHLADGNLHPNCIPRNEEDIRLATEALLEFAEAAIRLGGCPLSEHGVGRSPVKQMLLRRFLGDAAIERMREVKDALDPEGRFAPGVIFPDRAGPDRVS